MKTVEVVTATIGWHVTRKYFGRSYETKFFSTQPKQKVFKSESERKKAFKTAKEDAIRDKENYIKEWIGG